MGPKWPGSMGSDLSVSGVESSVWCHSAASLSPALTLIISLGRGWFSGFGLVEGISSGV